jgi:hypothetical protein
MLEMKKIQSSLWQNRLYDYVSHNVLDIRKLRTARNECYKYCFVIM